ncbi:pyrimidine dimer DNA glycosylase/endonuclease V [Dietzia psychralcaliphila]|uniref:pyrimidine dimer DNA glycosylase/endonuclease V n=1 Tax=Dietzia psychralcaliphila TaxID=139021 RepID=UPI001C1E79B8|nr:pyrimidine dimer DNA glycosylase/endonuclease V [Dietzia psychralcaliphila]
MRLWSIHPDQLDRAALVAGWREGLLAQKVLRGLTKGYLHHPQLERFRTMRDPVVGIATWLHGLADAADARGYRFDRTRIALPAGGGRLDLTDGQLALEWRHLRDKVGVRDPVWLGGLTAPRSHPMFDLVPGPVAAWERSPHPEA